MHNMLRMFPIKMAVLLLMVCALPAVPEMHAGFPAPSEHYSIQFVAVPIAQKEKGRAIYERLKAKGYLVYYYKTQIKGTDWMRLKAGLFPTVTQAKAFGIDFKQREGFDFFVTNANVRVNACGSEFEIITTPSAIWIKKNSVYREILLFSRDTVASADGLSRVATTISPDGTQVISQHGSRHYTIQLNSEKIAVTENNRPTGSDVDDAETYYQRGFSHYRQENLEQAAENFDNALRLDPQHTAAYYYRGIVHYRQGQYDRAIADCTSVLEIDPRYSDAYSIRALVWLEKGEPDRAIKDCDSALKINPHNIAAYSTLGVAWLQKGELEWACSDLRKACELGRCDTLDTVKKQGYCQ